MVHSRSNSIFQFKLIPNAIHKDPNDIYQSFVEIDQNLI